MFSILSPASTGSSIIAVTASVLVYAGSSIITVTASVLVYAGSSCECTGVCW